MIDRRIVSLSFGLTLCLVTASFARAESSEVELAAKRWRQKGWPLLQKYCLDCHNSETAEAELDLSSFDSLQAIENGGGAMQRVLEMVRFGAMPPEDADLPSAADRKALVAALDQTLYAASCDLRPRAGKVTIRRLNRAEYNHSIRDLFGVDLRPADAFPSDEVGAGFDNNGDVLSLSPMLMEKYFAAAELVASQALVDPADLPRLDQTYPGDQLFIHGEVKTGRFNGRFLSPDAFAWIEIEVPLTGEYRVKLYGGNTEKQQPPTTLAVYDDNGLLRGKQDLKYYGGSGSSDRAELRLQFQKGVHRLILEPIDDPPRKLVPGKTRSEKFAQLKPEWQAQAAANRKKRLKPDDGFDSSKFPFMIRRIGIAGPTSPPPELIPPKQAEILRKRPRRQGDRLQGVREAAITSLQPLMRKVFREPVTPEEVEPYADLVVQATRRGESYYRGMQIAISGLLMSPRFLFRVETPPDRALEPGEETRLSQHQLATRLSYFLWSSTPDERLLEDADHHRLDEKRLAGHIRRMLADPKSEALASQFAAQWLGLRNLDEHEVDADLLADFSEAFKSTLARETELVFLHMVRQNRPVAELLTADYSYLNETLARHYGIQGVQGEDFRKVSLRGTSRRGILSHASVLTLTSNPARTSPVKRGKWVLENILGTPPPDPPAGVPELEDSPTADTGATLREQLEVHRASPSCAACHRVMDQLGFGLEQYDAVGRYRQRDAKGAAIDASGQLPGGRSFDGAARLSEVLGKSERKAFATTVVTRLLTFAIGRELTPGDRCTVDEIVAETASDGHRLVDLIFAVVNSRPFQYSQWHASQPHSPTDSREEI
ncbi:MAG: DUF1592 domain-containing protein [Pirellulales bacterium]|nr:DUF1592 domain-containing protein [Pirellulales bacterium]